LRRRKDRFEYYNYKVLVKEVKPVTNNTDLTGIPGMGNLANFILTNYRGVTITVALRGGFVYTGEVFDGNAQTNVIGLRLFNGIKIFLNANDIVSF
jgi:hypothetical protein